MRIDTKAEYYVGRPGYNDPTANLVFGNPALRPEEDWGWLKPATVTPVKVSSDNHIEVHNLSSDQFVNLSRQTIPSIVRENKPPTETARRLTAIETQLISMRAKLGRRARIDEGVMSLKEEYNRLVRERRKEKSKERR